MGHRRTGPPHTAATRIFYLLFAKRTTTAVFEEENRPQFDPRAGGALVLAAGRPLRQGLDKYKRSADLTARRAPLPVCGASATSRPFSGRLPGLASLRKRSRSPILPLPATLDHIHSTGGVASTPVDLNLSKPPLCLPALVSREPPFPRGTTRAADMRSSLSSSRRG